MMKGVIAGCIPQRYVLAIMGFLCLVNMFTIRVSLNVAITEMVLDDPNGTALLEDAFVDPDGCPDIELETRSSTNSSNTTEAVYVRSLLICGPGFKSRWRQVVWFKFLSDRRGCS